MDVLDNTSALWCTNPVPLHDGMEDLYHTWFAGHTGQPDGQTVSVQPWSPMPCPTPWATTMDTVTNMYLALPMIWLPQEVWARYGTETNAAWHMRMMLTLTILNQVDVTDHGQLTYRLMDTIPTNPDRLAAMALSAATGEGSEDADQCRQTAAAWVDVAWPDGYPLTMLCALARDLVPVCEYGSAVLSAYTAVAYATVGADGQRYAVRMLRTLRDVYPQVFTPDALTPQAVTGWYRAHRQQAVDMMNVLADLNLEHRDMATIVANLLS